MGSICTPVRYQNSDIINLSNKISLDQHSFKHDKLFIITFCQSKNLLQKTVDRKYISEAHNNRLEIEIDKKMEDKSFNLPEFRRSLDGCYMHMISKLESSKSLLLDTILIKQPNDLSVQSEKILFKIIIEKIECLHSLLNSSDLRLRVQLPWRKMSTNDKNVIIRSVKNSRIQQAMSFSSQCGQSKQFSVGYFEQIRLRHRQTEKVAQIQDN